MQLDKVADERGSTASAPPVVARFFAKVIFVSVGALPSELRTAPPLSVASFKLKTQLVSTGNDCLMDRAPPLAVDEFPWKSDRATVGELTAK
jgi:hypothetical protein